jgi:rRNA-processing protein FCF1
MNCVLLDANFLLIPSQFQVDVYEELRMLLPGKMKLIIVPEVLEEIQCKSKQNTSTKFQRNVKMALQVLKLQQMHFPEYFITIQRENKINLPVDDYLITIAQKYASNPTNRTYIATNDKELREKAFQKGIRVVYLRQKKYLEISS